MIREKLKIYVEEFTTPDPAFVGKDENVKKVDDLMNERSCRHVLVKEGNKSIGIISQRDLFKALLRDDYANLLAKDIMQKDPFKVRYDETIEKVAFAMSSKKIGSALIEDENGEISGIFTTTDALNALVEILRGEA